MRIISQDGGYDLPYEETVLAKMENTVIAYSLSDLDGVDYLTMAEYSTKEKPLRLWRCVEKNMRIANITKVCYAEWERKSK